MRRAPPVVDGRRDLLGPFRLDAQRCAQPEQVLHGRKVDIQLGGFRDEFDPHVAAGKDVIHACGALRNQAPVRHIDRPQQLDISAMHGARGEVIGCGGHPLRSRCGRSRCERCWRARSDRGQSGREPQHSQ